MKRHDEQTGVEFSLGPHSGRRGWETVRIAYDPARPDHMRQIDAAITAMVRARSGAMPDAPAPAELAASAH